jgi:hypothetical protein
MVIDHALGGLGALGDLVYARARIPAAATLPAAADVGLGGLST